MLSKKLQSLIIVQTHKYKVLKPQNHSKGQRIFIKISNHK